MIIAVIRTLMTAIAVTLFVAGCIVTAEAQLVRAAALGDAWLLLDRGETEAAIRKSDLVIGSAAGRSNPNLRAEAMLIKISCRLAAFKYSDADAISREAVALAESGILAQSTVTEIYFAASETSRKARKLDAAIDFARRGRAAGAGSGFFEGIYNLRVGAIFVSKSYYVAANIYLDRAAAHFLDHPQGRRYLIEVYKFQTFAYSARMDFPSAISTAEKQVATTKNSQFQSAYRNALFEYGSLQSGSGQLARAYRTFAKCLEAAVAAADIDLERQVLATVALNHLSDANVAKAVEALGRLESCCGNDSEFDILLIKAIVAGFHGRRDEAERLFREIEERKLANSPVALPSWRIIVAERTGRWSEVLIEAENLRKIVEKYNYRDMLPFVETSLAKAHIALGQKAEAAHHSGVAVGLVDEMRQQSPAPLSLDILNQFHDSLRVAADASNADVRAAFVLAENFKARVLHDKLAGSARSAWIRVSTERRGEIATLASTFLDDADREAELREAEINLAIRPPENRSTKIAEWNIEDAIALSDSTVVSYYFSALGNLSAFVWDRENGVRAIDLKLKSADVEKLAAESRRKILNRVFYKRDGLAIFERLLKPLGRLKKHLLIIPDRAVWQIPIQALSADGKRYLIEDHVMSYAPSVPIALRQLSSARPVRKTIKAFANKSFGGRILNFVDREATDVARIYGSPPILAATTGDFKRHSANADIVHLSMHAELDSDRALDSFLGFRSTPTDDGRLSVEELLDLRLKPGSLAFIASCETNSVNNAEGPVSLAWAMTAAGATTVISAGWEADDRSASEFSGAFYGSYKSGQTAAESLRAAALAMISNKSNEMHEPYYWAAFSLIGDFR